MYDKVRLNHTKECMTKKNNEMGNKQVGFIKLDDGIKLYIEYYNNNKANTVLFIHGGPGESCISFSYLAFLASRHVNVVMLDQRGVMRSQRENRIELLNIQQLINDFEEVREKLNIKYWYLLGHSFGGYLAMRYVLLHKESILGVIYENPCFDIKHSLTSVINNYIKYYNDIKEFGKKQKMEELLRIDDIVKKMDSIISFPAIDRKRVFNSESITPKCREFYNHSLITPEAICKSLQHYNTIKYDKSLYVEYFSKLKYVNCPSLLIQGEKDPILPLIDKEQFLMNSKYLSVCISGAGHYVHSDAPEVMVNLLYKFIYQNSIGRVR